MGKTRFNREYHRRAVRQAIEAEIALGYYRPAKIPAYTAEHKLTAPADPQLELNFEADRPLADVFPEAYA